MSGVLATLKAATPATRVVTVVLDGKLQAEWDQALDALREAVVLDKTRTPGASLADVPATTEQIERLDELRGRIERSKVDFHVVQIDWRRRIALQAEHLPRPDHLLDMRRGWNSDTYPAAIIRATVVKIVGSKTNRAGKTVPDETTDIPDEVWDHLLGVPGRDPDPDNPDDQGATAVPAALNLRAVTDLQAAAEAVNDQVSKVPPSARSFLATPGSGASSPQPGPGTSAPSGSEAGSRPSSPSSSTTTTDGSDAS